mmetsp:Transcript_64538/g.189217  ORF Transcript_64538/g.189217 Transcript_64538/m.189217 type:complete len:234 (-) Transcript_64538:258-959(-)
MKPDWDKLTEDFQDSPKSGIYDVDCTGEGKSLCEKVKVSGYPTIKWGDPDELKEYSGGRAYADLKAFADENLAPRCGHKNLELCDEDTRKLIEGLMALPTAELKERTQATKKANSVKEKEYSKSRRKFDRSYEEFAGEQAEHEEQTRLHEQEEAKFEQRKAKGAEISKQETAKREKKAATAKERAAKFDKRKAEVFSKKAAFDETRAALGEEIKKTGYTHMKALLKQREKEEL